GFIELPRELPGLLCMAAVSILSGMGLGDMKTAMVAQLLMIVGILVLGVVTPSFAVMLVFLFINSLGMHLFIPLRDSIGVSLIKDGHVGSRLGQFNGIMTAASLVAGVLVFVGFKVGFFTFEGRVVLPFLLSGLLLVVIFILFLPLRRIADNQPPRRERMRLVVRKKYRYYYYLAILNGAHKQIMVVFGPWVLIELLGRKADTLAILGVVGSAIGIFFLPALGKWVDRFGPARLMTIEGASFITVYLAYALLSGGFSSGALGKTGWAVIAVFVLFALNKMAMQFGLIRTVYLRKIVDDPSELTAVLSTGVSMDHFVSITLALAGGYAWQTIGPESVFYLAAGLSVLNVVVSMKVDRQMKAIEQPAVP
ncbi:MAG: MFS transporter, partial [Clostridia bacterium]|nr:MFS transporter [Clostridia bacterium]